MSATDSSQTRDFIIQLVTAITSLLVLLLQLFFKKDNIMDKISPRPEDKGPRRNGMVIRRRLDSLHEQVQNLTPKNTPPDSPPRTILQISDPVDLQRS